MRFTLFKFLIFDERLLLVSSVEPIDTAVFLLNFLVFVVKWMVFGVNLTFDNTIIGLDRTSGF